MGLIEIPNPRPGIVDHINERLGTLLETGVLELPDFSQAQSVLSVSDYAGEDAKKTGRKSNTYQVLSFVILDWNNAQMWALARLALRINQLGFVRSMGFKKLNKDRERLRLLKQFLENFDQLEGLVITYLIHNDIRYLFSDRSMHKYLADEGCGKWKPHVAEKILRVCHLQAPFVFKLTSSNNKFFWLTDRDSITEDMNGLGRILQSVFNIYATHGFTDFAYAQPFIDPTMALDDLLSIPDLVGGAILEYVLRSDMAERGLEDGLEIQDKTNLILEWFSNRNSRLKKVTCKIYRNRRREGLAIEFGGFDKRPE